MRAGRIAALLLLGTTAANALELQYAPAPVDNPLKGLVPYASSSGKDRFPHSMEFRYFALNALMTGPAQFNWTPLEQTLNAAAGRGKQTVFRVYIEYPGKASGLPAFLRKAGVTETSWLREADEGGKGKTVVTPDYRDPKLRAALKNFVAALGERYDGDPRVGFITAGLLGLWGEWHDYPREELWAPKDMQNEVMQAFEAAFKKTKILLRYPAGPKDYRRHANTERAFGYHDDSFAWATLPTGRKQDRWFFVPAMRAAGATDQWKRFPIGGEIRPELWPRSFTAAPHPRGQDFARCVRETHVSWLMDTGLFDRRIPLPADRKTRALKEVARMGYELHVRRAEMKKGFLVLQVENRGVAPFYYDWPVELRYAAPNIRTRPVFPDWKISRVLPGQAVEWRVALGSSKNISLRLRIANPMPGGKALRFANRECKGDWLELAFE